MENQIEFQDQENLLEKLRTNQQNANFQQRLQALNLEIDPKNPEGKLGQSVVNGINAVPIIKDFFALNDNWNAKKQNMEKQTEILEPLQNDGELLKKIEKNLTKNGILNKVEFAKSAVNILSRDDNKDLLEEYLKGKTILEEEIKTAITNVNSKKHILLTGSGHENFKAIKTKPEERNKELIEFLGYKTKGEIDLMSPAEISKTIGVLKEDFGFTLKNDGKTEYQEPKTKSENYQKELKTANNINESSKEGEGNGELDYGKQNNELETQKAKEKAKEDENNKNYSRTSTGETPQSGMSTENMAGNAAVLGGAIAAAVVIPFVGWIVALAILYSFKDKFKDDPKADKELYENVAKGLEKGGQTPEQAQKTIANLQKEVEQLKNNQHHDQKLIKDISKQFEGKNPEDVESYVKKIQEFYKKNKDSPNLEKDFNEFIEKQKINPESLKNISESLDDNKDKELKNLVNNTVETLKNNQENVVFDNKNNTQQNQDPTNPKIHQKQRN